MHGSAKVGPILQGHVVHAAKRPALRRYWLIDRELRAQTFPTAERLAELAEVDARTIRRDIGQMRDDFYAPIEFNFVRNGWEYTSPTYRLPAVLITEGELLALFLAGQVLHQHQGTPYEQHLRHAIDKLAQFLPDEISIQWAAVDQAHSFRQSATTLHDVDTFRRLADAVLHRRQLRLRYWTASRDAETERVVDPWHLACIDGEWYLIGWCHQRQARRVFAPARIRGLEETGGSFTVPDDFRIGEFFDGAFRVIQEADQPLQTVRLRFAPSAAKYIREKVWHASQVLRSDPDGGVTLELSLRSLIEVRRWVLWWGGECTVLEPAALRDAVRAEAAAILERAASTPPIPKISSRVKPSPKSQQRAG